MKTLYKVFRSEDWALDNEILSANRSVTMFDVCEGLVPVLCSCAAIVESFSCRHEKLSYAHVCQLDIPDFSKVGVTMETYCLTRK